MLIRLAHVYQGMVAVADITLVGLICAVVTIRRGNLRAVILAHVLVDSAGAVQLYLGQCGGPL